MKIVIEIVIALTVFDLIKNQLPTLLRYLYHRVDPKIYRYGIELHNWNNIDYKTGEKQSGGFTRVYTVGRKRDK